MTTKIDEIVSKEALEQVDLLTFKLKEVLSLEKKLGNSVLAKICALSDLIGDSGHEIKVDLVTFKMINKKLQELIPLL
jgi:hypothetical protein